MQNKAVCEKETAKNGRPGERESALIVPIQLLKIRPTSCHGDKTDSETMEQGHCREWIARGQRGKVAQKFYFPLFKPDKISPFLFQQCLSQ